MLLTATSTCPFLAAVIVMAISGEVGGHGEQDEAAEGAAEAESVRQDVGVVRQKHARHPDGTSASEEDEH